MATNRGFGFINDGIYHVFNRGVERRPVFTNTKEYRHFTDAIWFYRYPHQMRLSYFFDLSLGEQELFRHSLSKRENNKIVTLLAYCLMPNHFHLILRQNMEKGISTFIANVTNSYTKYFNTKYKRPGSLFQGPFKAVRVETENQLLHLSRYVHINPVVSGITTTNSLSSYPWSSLPEYEENTSSFLCDRSWLPQFFTSPEKYSQFLHDQIDYATKLESIKHLALDEE